MKKILISLLILLAPTFLPLAAHDNEPHATLDISQAWARKTGSRTASAAVYLDIKNLSETPEHLLSAGSTRASMAMIHRSSEKDGIMRMEMQDSVEIKPGDTVSFEPGGLHIMLTNLDKPLKQGQVFPLTLSFEHAGEVEVFVEVTGITGLDKQ